MSVSQFDSHLRLIIHLNVLLRSAPKEAVEDLGGREAGLGAGAKASQALHAELRVDQ